MTSSEFFFLVVVSCCTYSFEIMFGLAGTILLLPLLSPFFEVKDLIVYSVLPQILVATIALFNSPKVIDWKFFVRMVAAGFAGALVGFFFFQNLPKQNFQLLLAVFITAAGIYSLAFPRGFRLKSYLFPLFDIFSGFSHALFGISGPIVMTRLMSSVEEKTTIRNYALAFFCSFSLIRFAWYLFSQQVTAEISHMMLGTAPFLLVVLFFGNRLHFRIPDLFFKRIAAILIIVSGVLLFLKR